VFEDDVQVEPPVPHPAGIVLHRSGYYTLPSLDELAKLYEETNRCEVSNFTIGRANYGNIYFNESMDVAGLNLDEIGKSCASLLCIDTKFYFLQCTSGTGKWWFTRTTMQSLLSAKG